MSYNIYDVIIIGGGPAGATAGIYVAREKLKTLLITKDFGGQIARKAVAIENYPGFQEVSGAELIQKFEEHLKKFNPDIEIDEIIKIAKQNDHFIVSTKNKKEIESKTVIITSGADPRPLEVKGEKEFIGKGVSYCTTCDGPLFGNKIVTVIGGGNSGFEAAIALTKFASKVYILEYLEKVMANEVVQEQAQKIGKIEVITNVALQEIKGADFVESIIYQDRGSQDNKTLEVQGVFVEIGNQPATSFVGDLVDFNGRDEIKIDPKTCGTKTQGLFAAGDVTNVMLKQIVVAAGEGAKAAISAYKYLQN